MSSQKSITGKAFDFTLLRRVFSLISPYRGQFVVAVILTVALAVIGPSIPFAIQKTIDKQILNLDFRGLWQMSLLILGLLFLQAIVNYFQTYLTSYLGQNAILHLRSGIFKHVLGFRSRVFDRTPIGTLITRTISDVETVADVFAQGLINIIGDLLQLLVIIVILFFLDWELTLVCLSLFPLLFLSSYVFKEKVKAAFQQVRTQVSRLNAFLQEHITGVQIIQVFGREKDEMERFKRINGAHRDANIRGIMAYSIFFPVIEILSAITIALIVWYGSGQVLEGELTFGVVTAFILYINMMFRPIRQIADKFNTLQMGMVASERIFRLMSVEDSIPDEGKLPAREIRGQIEFRNVWFAYEQEDWVLKDVSFKVEPGQTLAIVGATGAGKTTIINLINRLYEIQKGSICLDGEDIRDYPLAFLRRVTGVVLQDVFLFSDTIENNIRIYNDTISEEELEQAARLVGAEKFINRLPNGLRYEVQERGATLSSGQRQLISFIRAIIQDPRVLILDEATSSVDNETEEMLQHAIQVLLKDRTSIVIAHRLSTIQHASQIMVMDKGKIVEAGTHQELLTLNGHYKKLYQLQFAELVV
ncbi:MAG: ABC transporter ATP-binding protein [Bacteroidia bacterium]